MAELFLDLTLKSDPSQGVSKILVPEITIETYEHCRDAPALIGADQYDDYFVEYCEIYPHFKARIRDQRYNNSIEILAKKVYTSLCDSDYEPPV